MKYDLSELGAALPRSLMLVEEFDETYQCDETAPRSDGLPDKFGRIWEDTAKSLLADARLLAASVDDNDQEIWFITKAGEFVRATGDGSATFYVVGREDAIVHLEDFAEDESIARLRELGLLPLG